MVSQSSGLIRARSYLHAAQPVLTLGAHIFRRGFPDLVKPLYNGSTILS